MSRMREEKKRKGKFGVRNSGFGIGDGSFMPNSPPRAPHVEDSAFRIPHSAFAGGFTFVELLIAATMIAILIVGLASHLRGGIRVWQRATETTETIQRQRVALDQLERELAGAIVFDSRDTAYGTEEGRLPAPAFGPHELRWFTVSPSATSGIGSVRYVTYTCGSIDDTAGLWRTSQSVREARLPSTPATPELVLPGCLELTLHYAYLPSDSAKPLEWYPEWNDAYKELPRLISASFLISPETNRIEEDASAHVQTRRVERIFSIPVGLLKKQVTPP